MNKAVTTIVVLFLLGIIAFTTDAIPTMRVAYYERHPIEEIQVYAQKRPVITWQLLMCRKWIQNPDGSFKSGGNDEWLACRDLHMHRTDI